MVWKFMDLDLHDKFRAASMRRCTRTLLYSTYYIDNTQAALKQQARPAIRNTTDACASLTAHAVQKKPHSLFTAAQGTLDLCTLISHVSFSLQRFSWYRKLHLREMVGGASCTLVNRR